MKLGKKVENTFKTSILNGLTILRWGTLRPTHVCPPGGASKVCINPDDALARKKLVHDTLRRKMRFHRAFWKQMCEQSGCNLALDVGVNYGECLFTPAYPPTTTAVGYEANPQIEPYLKQSKALHPQSDQIHLCPALVGESHGGEADFHIDTLWSGSSSAAKLFDDAGRYQVTSRPCVSVDGQISELGLSPKGIVFKIDVEGYESYVLKGMMRTLAKTTWAIGLIEFNPVFASAAGVDVRAYYDRLQSAFHVYGVSHHGKVVDLQGQGIQAVGVNPTDDPAVQPSTKQPFPDLILTKGRLPDVVEQFISARA